MKIRPVAVTELAMLKPAVPSWPSFCHDGCDFKGLMQFRPWLRFQGLGSIVADCCRNLRNRAEQRWCAEQQRARIPWEACSPPFNFMRNEHAAVSEGAKQGLQSSVFISHEIKSGETSPLWDSSP